MSTRQVPISPTPGSESAASMLGTVDAASALGCSVDLPEVAKARKLAERGQEIAATAARLRARATDPTAVNDLAKRLHAGDLDDDALLLAVSALQAASDSGSLLARVLYDAQRQVDRAVFDVLRKPGDRWVAALRPRVDELVEQAVEHVHMIPPNITDRLGAHGHAAGPGVARAWDLLAELLDRLEELWSLAEQWRGMGMVPTTGRPYPEDLRWRYPDRLTGSTLHREAFFARNVRGGCEPGVYTDAEQAEAREQSDAPTAA